MIMFSLQWLRFPLGEIELRDLLQDQLAIKTKCDLEAQKREMALSSKCLKNNTQLTFRPWRVFINHLDSYHGKKLTSMKYLIVRVMNSAIVEDDVFQVLSKKAPADSLTSLNMKKESKSIAQGVERNKPVATTQERERRYEIIGTLANCKSQSPENVRIINPKNKVTFIKELLNCGTIIYDISLKDNQVEEARWVFKEIMNNLEKTDEQIGKILEPEIARVPRFILISTIMTWALTKPLDAENLDAPFTEADYTKRKPHPDFREHKKCEDDVLTIHKSHDLSSKIKTLILCCGVTYGDEEGPLHFYFKMAWQNALYLPIFGSGTNKIPLLHVQELARIVSSFFYTWPKIKYLVATEFEAISQTMIVTEISKALTTGETKQIASEKWNSQFGITLRDYQVMTVNVNIEPAYTMDLNIQSDVIFGLNFETVVKEYRTSRNLEPMKIIIFGPPVVGKTKLAKRLSSYYRVPYISIKSLTAETIQHLTTAIEQMNFMGGIIKDDAKSYDNIVDAEKRGVYKTKNGSYIACRHSGLQQQLDEIQHNQVENNGRLEYYLLNKIFLKRLTSTECLNQGYVIDGYPTDLQEAQELFNHKNGNENLDEDNSGKVINILPEVVIVLGATDQFLIDRILNLPEKKIQYTYHTVESLILRLREYRKKIEQNMTPLQFYSDKGVHSFYISIENDSLEMLSTFQKCLEIIGKPRNYNDLSILATSNIYTRNDEDACASSVIKLTHESRKNLQQIVNHDTKMYEWAISLEKLREKEEKQLQIIADFDRLYLEKYVLPMLTQGLIKVLQLRPDEPIDFLAEYLFKENPDGKMIELDSEINRNINNDII